MNTPLHWLHRLMLPTLCVGSVLAAIVAVGAPVVISSQSKPMTVQGTSQDSVKSDCGFIPKVPSQRLQLQDSLPYLLLQVKGDGQPTLLVDGPGGRFCILSDQSNTTPKMSGFWAAGTYAIYVGDRTPSPHAYTLTISPQDR
jgi:hypothetical protein